MKRFFWLLLTSFLCLNAKSQYRNSLLVAGLQCEFKPGRPVIDNSTPRFGWRLENSSPLPVNENQTAFQVQVSSDSNFLQAEKPDMWDTRRQRGATMHTRYYGKPLRTDQTYFWRVKIWNEQGLPSPWSSISAFAMGVLKTSDWKAHWIADTRALPEKPEALYGDLPAPRFRKTFTVSGSVARAFLHISGLGYFEACINGEKTGREMLSPAWSDYSKTIYYATYDVTTTLKRDHNCIDVLLGNGWFNPLPMNMWRRINLRQHLPIGQPCLIAQLTIEYTDGRRERIVSDTSWKVQDSYIIRNNVYLGETQDCTVKNIPSAGANDDSSSGAWRQTRWAPPPAGKLTAQNIPPTSAAETLHPAKISLGAGGKYIVDMGVNFGGIIRLRASGKTGDTVTLRYGELLYPDSTLNVMTSVAGQVKNRGSAGPGAPDTAYRKDVFILSGRQNDEFEPVFSYTGFRYVEISNYPGVLKPADITGFRVHSLVEETGHFDCSNKLLDTIQTLCINTFLSNLQGVQSDCPHRERFGYGGDIAATNEALMANFNMHDLYDKTLSDYSDAQRPDGAFTETAPFVGIGDFGLSKDAGPVGWGFVFPVLMRNLYRYYGDETVIARYYPALKRWIAYLEAHAVNYIIDNDIGDHESLDPKSIPLEATLFFYASVQDAGFFASILHLPNDETQDMRLAAKIKSAVVKKFVDIETGKVDIGTQAAQSFALNFGILPSALLEKSVQQLMEKVQATDYHVATGMFGTPYMLRALSNNDQFEAAYKMVTRHGFPGWGYMIEQGATSIWEHWAYSDNTFSHNHPMWGSVSEWLYGSVAGIQPAEDAIGFNKITIKPMGWPVLNKVNASINTIRGRVSVKWDKDHDPNTIEITIPVNAKATLLLPLENRSEKWTANRLLPRSKNIVDAFSKEWQEIEAGSGVYRFSLSK